MTEDPDRERRRTSRRRVLAIAGKLSSLGVLATTATTSVTANPGEQQWALGARPPARSPTPTATANQQWSFETDGEVVSSPTVVDETVFVGSRDNNLYAIDAETGQEQWAFETDNQIVTSPTVVDGTVFVNSEGRYLYAVDAETGQKQWVDTLPGGSSLTVADGTVFISSNYLYAISAETGQDQWVFEGPRKISPTVAGGTVFASNSSNLYAVDVETGQEQWTFEKRIQSTPTVADGTVFLGGGEPISDIYVNKLYAVDAKTGQEQWRFGTGSGNYDVSSSPTVIDGTVFAGGIDNNLYTVDAETGQEQWTFETDDQVVSSPTVAGGTVFFGSRDNNLYAVDAETGHIQWSFETDGEVVSSPTVVDGTVFVGSKDNNLYAMDTGISASSVGSRTRLGTLGHHDDWQYADQSINIPIYALYISRARNNRLKLARWSAICGGGIGGGYLLYRRSRTEQSKQESSGGPSDELPDTSTAGIDMPTTSTEQSKQDDSSVVEELRSEAEEALNAAVTASEAAQFDEAADAYRAALTQYQSALDEVEPGDTETRAEIRESIESAREELEMVTTRQDYREDIIETLSTAERSFQVGIVAYAQASETLARIRFRQARDGFDDALDLLKTGDENLLTPPVEINVQPDRELASTEFRELPMIPEAATVALTDAGIDTVDKLEASEEPAWTPAVVETLVANQTVAERVETTLTLLSWWDDSDSYEFDTISAISRRREQAHYGYTQSS